MMPPSVIFFGSFGHYSAIVLELLHSSSEVNIVHVVTSPEFTNRKGKLEKSPVQALAEKLGLPFTTALPESFTQIRPDFEADFLVTAGYGHLLPGKLLAEPKIAALNLHFSVLPKYRGANPGEWAILMGEAESGISIIEMNEKFDEGGVIFTANLPIAPTDTRESLYEKLYTLGGQCLPKVISQVAAGELAPQPQPETDLPYASRLKRDDGYVSWSAIESLMLGQSARLDQISEKLAQIARLQKLNSLNPEYLERAARALFGFPSLWTLVNTAKGEKRMKIHSAAVDSGKLKLNSVQIEGQLPSSWNQVKNQILANK